MRYSYRAGINKLRMNLSYGISTLVLVGMSLGGALPAFITSTAHAAGAKDIYTVSDLRNAIENQANGETWNIHAGNYGLSPFTDITAGCPTSCQKGWYLPITADNLTINGIGNPTIYGTGYTANGNWATQDFVAIFGDNVTLNDLTLMPKVEPNKTIEVMGSNSTIKDVTVEPNTLDTTSYGNMSSSDQAWAKQWGGSIYYNGATGTQTLENVTIENGGISDHSPSATISLTNVKLNYATNVDWINGYRLASHGNTVSGAPLITYHVNNTLNNLDSVLANIQNDDVIELDSDLTTSHQITLTKSVTFNGNGHTITGTFDTNYATDQHAVLGFSGIASGHTQVNNLTVDGGNHNIHGIQMYDSSALTTLWRVTVENNGRSGVNVNNSNAQVVDITAKNNGARGAYSQIDVDKGSASLQVAGINHFFEDKITTGPATGFYRPDIYVDAGHANPSNPWVTFHTGDTFVHFDNYYAPGLGDRAYFLAPHVGVTAPTGLTNTNTVEVKGWAYGDSMDYYACYITTNQPITAFGKSWSTGQEPKDGPTNSDSLADNACVTTFTNGVGNSSNPVVLGHFDVSGLPDGSYTIHVHAHNAYRAVSNEVTTTFTIDRTAPAVPTNLGWKTSTNVVIPNGGVTNVYGGTASWQDSDVVDHYIYKYWNDISGNQYKVGSEYTTPVSTTSLYVVFNQGQGVHHFCVEAVDAAGNTSPCSATFTITYDKTAPTATINAYSGTDTAPTITGTVDDPTAGLTIAIDGVTAQAAKNNGDGTWSFTVLTALSTGAHTVVLTATDAASNSYSTSANAVVTAAHASVRGLSASNSNGNSNQATGHQPTVTVTPNNDGHVLGADTTSPTTTSSDSTDNGKVKGASTEKTDTIALATNTRSGAFLGLGWWWLVIIAVVVGFFAVLLRKADSNAKN